MDFLGDAFRLITTPEGILEIVAWGGYVALIVIVFAETGLLFGFFLPGDSLLVMAGLVAATGALEIGTLNALLIPAAIAGDALGYAIGHRSGSSILRREGRFLKRKHIARSRAFYQRHGARTIIIARFVPVVRTFAPVLAGVSGMRYSRFVVYNVVGAILWIASTTLAGYLLGTAIPNINRYLHLVIGAVIALSLIPPFLEFLRERREKKEGMVRKTDHPPETTVES